MVQVDVFWTFAIGSSFAVAANRQLEKEDNPVENKYWRYNLLFHSILFVPSGVYLLSANPGWETMYMLSRDMPAIIPCLFAMTNILFGLLGFHLAYRLIKAGKAASANLLWLFGYGCMFTILGTGWRRFFYAGTFEDWHGAEVAAQQWFRFVPGDLPEKVYPITDFFSCHIFYALLGMGVIIIPAVLYPYFMWPREAKNKP